MLELGGQGHGGAVVRFGRHRVRMVGMRRNLAEEAEGPRLVTALAALADELQAAVSRSAGVFELVGEEVRLAELQRR